MAKRTVQKHIPRVRGQSWAPFLRKHMHQTWACDFLQLYDIWFQPIFAFFVVDFGACKGRPWRPNGPNGLGRLDEATPSTNVT